MSLFTKRAEDWTLADVERLVSESIEEGQRLEYKQELHLGSRAERREAARDTSGMANASGGLLIYGVAEGEEDDGRVVPDRVTPLRDHALRDQLEDILDSSISPRPDVELNSIGAPDGGYVLLLRVRERAGALHMVESYGDHSFYIRRGRRVTPMTEREVAGAYEQVSSAARDVDTLIASTPLLPRIAPHRSRLFDKQDARLHTAVFAPWLSVVTVPARPHRQPVIDILAADQNAFPHTPDTARLRKGSLVGPAGYEADQHGYFHEVAEDVSWLPPFKVRMRLYRNGILEWGTRSMRMAEGAVPSRSITENVHDVLAYFGTVYRRANYFGPVLTWIGLENVDNTRLEVRDSVIEPVTARALEGEADLYVKGPDVTADQLADEPLFLARRAMDVIWQAYGWPRCQLFDEDGTYNPDRSW